MRTFGGLCIYADYPDFSDSLMGAYVSESLSIYMLYIDTVYGISITVQIKFLKRQRLKR